MEKIKTVETTLKVKREPLVRLAKRDNATFAYKSLVRLLAVLFAYLLIMWFLTTVTGYTFGEVNGHMRTGAFGTEYTKAALAKNMMLLLGIGIALAPAFKMRFWNIGAQGQVFVGALISAILMWYLGGEMTAAKGISNGMMIFLCLVCSILVGGVWAAIPAFFKVKINANETLFTLMMNYVAIKLVAYFLDTWKGRISTLPRINTVSRVGWLSEMFGSEYGAIILVVAILAVWMFFYMRNTKHGYEIAVVGESYNTARYAGISTSKVILRTAFISGAICGLIGMLYVTGDNHAVSLTTGGSYGFTAIIVAWAAKFNPFSMALIAFAIVFLECGATGVIDSLTESILNSYTAYIIVGVFLLFLIGSEFFINYRLIYNAKITAFFEKYKAWLESKLPKTTACWRKITTAVKAFIEKVEGKLKVFGEKLSRKITYYIAKVAEPINEFFAKFYDKIKTKNVSRVADDAKINDKEGK
jgi:ABC-type uncharacterized transport system, permease component